MKKTKILFAAFAALVLAVSCQKVDLSQIESRLDSIDGRVTTLEGAVAALQDAVQKGLIIDKYEKTSKGYVLTFTNKETIELLNGENGATGATGAQGEKGDKGDKGDSGQDGKDGVNGQDGKDGKDGDSFLKSITEEDGFVVIVLNDEDSTTYRLPMANVIKIGNDEAVIYVPFQKNDTIALTISPLKDIASISATILARNGSTTDIKTKAVPACGWQVEVTADTNVVVFCNNQEDKALLQVSVVKKDGTTYTASKALEQKFLGLVLGPDMIITKTQKGVDKPGIDNVTYPWIEYVNPTSTLDDGTAEVQQSNRWTDLNPETEEKGQFIQVTGKNGSVLSPVLNPTAGKYFILSVQNISAIRVFATGSASGSAADGNYLKLTATSDDGEVIEAQTEPGSIYGKGTASDLCTINLNPKKSYRVKVEAAVKDIQVTGIKLINDIQ